MSGSSSKLGSSPTKVSRVMSSFSKKSSSSSSSKSSGVRKSLTTSFSSILSPSSSSKNLAQGLSKRPSDDSLTLGSVCDREVSDISHESGFFSAGSLNQGEIHQTFPRRRKNAAGSRSSFLFGSNFCYEGSVGMSSLSETDSTSVTTTSHKSETKQNSVKSQIQQQPTFLNLKPLFFEIPRCGAPSGRSSSSQAQECSQIFVGRKWIYREIHSHLTSHLPTNKGVIIKGGPGTGKTELIANLVENSFFGRYFKGEFATLIICILFPLQSVTILSI